MTKLDSCDIIRDLLPGYIDGVLSKTGTNAVKEHLENEGVVLCLYSLNMKN